MRTWTAAQIENVTGKRVVVTGASSGIGLQAAAALAAKGAEVILAVRSEEKGARALDQIRTATPEAQVSVSRLDLSDLASIQRFAQAFTERYDRLDLLINNAGVMLPPYRQTKDGFELQFGTNHLGHFALTGRLLPALLAAPGARIVTVSSIAARGARVDFDNLDGTKGYSAMKFYGQSKLANLHFAVELQRRLQQRGAGAISVGCHPGIAATNLMSRGSGKESGWLMNFAMKLVAQPAEMGALPTLYAATHPALKGGEYIGPNGAGNRKGYPTADTTDVAKFFDPAVANRLWTVSEQRTGVTYLS